MLVPHKDAYEVLLVVLKVVLVTPPSPPTWHPPVAKSGFIRPSSVGPQLEKFVIACVTLSTAPITNAFLLLLGGAVLRNPVLHAVLPRSLPAAHVTRNGCCPVAGSAPRTMLSIKISVTL
jgi:hypothetical protein